MLRRGKQQLESVSAAKRDLIIWLQLDDTQKRMYTSLSNGDSEKQVAQNSAACEPFLLLTSLMQTCNHPWLNLDDETYRGSIQNPFQHPEGGPELGNVFSSSKIAAGIALVVKCISENRKVLVFSRSKRMLDLFGVTLMNWLIDFMRVDGDTAPEERLDIVSQFSEKNNIWVLLLTTQVGGIGLTATAASGVVLLDPSWNPSIDAQAVDRVHRVGQTRDVVVYRLITCGTVEEKIYRNQIFKSMAAKQGTAGAEGVGEGGSVEFHRYFTRLQLRNIVDIGVLDHSETAIHLRCLNPDSVLETERSSLLSLPFVCDVSDNGCILVRSTDDDENDEEGVNIRSVEPCGGSLCQYHGDKALRPVKRFRPECSDQDGLSEYF
ncbi:Helicase conserved C terminal domain [Trypanosoma vivax]|nr:Helicase conserved C terminal domain [Trypanosoma vivax]